LANLCLTCAAVRNNAPSGQNQAGHPYSIPLT
jgi:hypothetical protein